MRLLNLLISILLATFSITAQTHLNINPTYVGVILIDEPTVEDMKSTCKYYKFEEQDAEGDYSVYKHPDGTILKFKIYFENGRKFPEVTIQTNVNKKEIEKILSDAGYKNVNGLYWRGTKYEIRRTKCDVKQGFVNTLTFTKEYNEI